MEENVANPCCFKTHTGNENNTMTSTTMTQTDTSENEDDCEMCYVDGQAEQELVDDMVTPDQLVAGADADIFREPQTPPFERTPLVDNKVSPDHSVAGTDADVFREPQISPCEKTPALKQAHMTRVPSANKVWTDLVDTLQTENARLRNINDQFCQELAGLRKDNSALNFEVQKYVVDQKRLVVNIQHAEETNRKLNEDLINERKRHSELKEEHTEIKRALVEKNTESIKQIDTLKKCLTQRDKRIQEISAELAKTSQKHDAHESMRERQMEMIHQLEVLKQEKIEVMAEKDNLKQQQKHLCSDMNSLKDQVQKTNCELRNEQLRHSVLTKEFNSLLNENSRLKTQLRHRLINTSTSTSTGDRVANSAMTTRIHSQRPLTKRHTYSHILTTGTKSGPILPFLSKPEDKL